MDEETPRANAPSDRNPAVLVCVQAGLRALKSLLLPSRALTHSGLVMGVLLITVAGAA